MSKEGNQKITQKSRLVVKFERNPLNEGLVHDLCEFVDRRGKAMTSRNAFRRHRMGSMDARHGEFRD